MRAPLAALLVALAACACALDADPRALLNSSWGRERGLKVNKVDFVRVSEGDGRFGLRGLVTTAAVKKGEALIHVPKGLGLTLATLKEFGLSFLWEQADLSRMSDHDNDVAVQQHFLTVLIIAIRRNPSHFYSEWLATWPREVHCTLAFTEAEMEELRATDTAAYDEGKYLRRILAWNFDYLNAILTDPRNPKIFDPPITIEEFAQAYTWSMTRDFAVSGGTSDDRAAILPIADYINHSNGKETVTLVELDNGGYEIQALSHLEPGTELTVTYGKLSNPALINYWGFVMTDNGYNTVTLDAPVAANAAFGGHKRRLLAEHGERLVTRPKSIDYLLPLLRLLVSDKPESFEEESVNAYLTGMLTSTTEDERKMLAYAVSLCDAALARLSAVPDNVPLVAKATPLSDNLKVILDLRREAKKMLTRMRDILEGMETAKSVGVAYKVPEDAVPDPEETEEEGAGAEGEFPDFAREFLDEQGKMV